ncbi:vacuolar peduncle [Culex quinquefasciatus]|uniref:Vacuolar peduncle n=1 Tax=Culex quinquefasciatus TaxID=7176 RepID=B0X6T1_CULQU|nr:vacuolar peduncle [Culex quinquefasciatus]|eukprot:XP_001865353.1 vacuolar peduncle [Culex quinquefasciatus]
MNTLKCRPGTPSSSDWNRSEPAFLQRNASLFRVKSTEGSSRVQRSSAFDSGLNIFRLFAPVLRKLGRDVAIWSWMSLKRQKEKQQFPIKLAALLKLFEQSEKVNKPKFFVVSGRIAAAAFADFFFSHKVLSLRFSRNFFDCYELEPASVRVPSHQGPVESAAAERTALSESAHLGGAPLPFKRAQPVLYSVAEPGQGGKTRVKTEPDPIWDEEFVLDDIPPDVVTNTITVLSKRNVEPGDWYPLIGMTPMGEWGSILCLYDIWTIWSCRASPLYQLLVEAELNEVRALSEISHNDRIPLAISLLKVFRYEKHKTELLRILCQAEVARENETHFRGASLATILMDLYMRAEFFCSRLCPTQSKEYSKSVVSNWPSPSERLVRTCVVSGFIFLRLPCPALLTPRQFGLVSETPHQMATRTLIMVAKCFRCCSDRMPVSATLYLIKPNLQTGRELATILHIFG